MKNVWKMILYFFERFLPSIAFFVMFWVFIVQIFFRYVLKQPLFWTFEVTFISYFWAIFLGGAYVTRLDEHVMFTMVYEKLSKKKKAVSKILSNTLVLIAFLFSFMPTIDYIAFLHGDKTSTLRLPFTTIFFPILIFIVLVMIHLVIDNIENIKILLKKDK